VRIIVTGGFGFIGSSFCELALKNGHELIIIDKMTYAADLENLAEATRAKIHFIELDISQGLHLNQALKGLDSADWIVNFAAESHVDRSIEDGIPFVSSNVVGVVNLLEFLKRRTEVKMLQVSTDEVFGSIQEGSWDEEFPLNPRSAYSSSKAAAEMFCNAYQSTHGVDVTITRCANNFGPRQSAEKLIPTVIYSALVGKPIPVYGDGSNRREWIYVDDHAASILKIVESKKRNSTKYNLSGTELSNLEIVKSILRIMNKNEDLISYVPDRLGHDFRYSVDDRRFRAEFGNYETSNFDARLTSTVDWYLSNQEWLARSKSKVTS
jgi:dTDP-glucose 4,6-dehydratase